MFIEAAEAAAVAERQIAGNADRMADAVARLRALDPPFVATIARGSSDHAATFAKYLIETRLRLPTLSHAPSIASLYEATSPKLAGVPLLVISQSGRSPDLIGAAAAAQRVGAVVVAIVNDVESPLADMADILLPLHAGPETSVAATKSFIATMVALAHLVAQWSADNRLLGALSAIGGTLRAAWAQDWSVALDPLREATNLIVLGRGLSLSVAQEAALKFKETSGLHAEAFSSAEVAHGPMALIREGFPLLVFPPRDAAAQGLDVQIDAFAERGANIFVAGRTGAGRMLPVEPDLHPVVAPIAMIQSFYRLAEALAFARGYDPDQPPFLNKVTYTL
ncbi:iron dicitrate transport regulator FecR [Sphingomonas oleivorans]|uniref:Iron dicitrate transport regulator FecR n=2 Tax=Sphingomonas oleivorans TaxID=1735121 RepID=A0A2T5FUS2_9SPHN|nr:iron dicitrate transport regulator FecR [Sphingomonas oleivorans]